MIGLRTTGIEVYHDHTKSRVRAGEVRLLKKVGFRARTNAIVSMKSSRGRSRPGSPPNSHLGLIGRFMRYAVDERKLSVIVGAEKLNRKSRNVLRSLEQGGASITTEGRTIRVAARPAMVPALVETTRLLPTFLTDSIGESSAQ